MTPESPALALSAAPEARPDLAPRPPRGFADVGVPRVELRDLLLRYANTVTGLTASRAEDEIALPEGLVVELLDELRELRQIEVLGADGPLTYRYGVTDLGRERARRCAEVCAWVGPAPVPVEVYRAQLAAQFEHLPEPRAEDVRAALAALVLPEEQVEVIGLACLSGRTLLIHGPAGNGKTEAGRMVHDALHGALWIPRSLRVDGSIVRLYDPLVHERLPEVEASAPFDRRWVCIRRPFVVVGGELTMDALELAYDPGLGCYEAPLHVKANGGTFLLDDFGCQRAAPEQLLRRWVYPLEHQEDHLTLRTGKKLHLPFRQLLIVSTNLEPNEVMEPAFLRRMGYRLHLGHPTDDVYREIFTRYAARQGLDTAPGLVDGLLDRYRREGRQPRGCEPRDLIERARDLCRYRGRTFELEPEVLDRAWAAYFGEQGSGEAA